MGVWGYSAGFWKLTGSAVRTVLAVPTVFPGTKALKLSLVRRQDEVRVWIYGTRDGRTTYEVGIGDGADNDKVCVYKRTFGGAPTLVASAALGVAASVPFTMQVQVVHDAVAVYINGSAAATLSYTLADATYLRYRHYGFVSSIANAVVLSFTVCDLVQDSLPRQDALVWGCNGNVFLSVKKGQGAMLKAGVFNAEGRVSFADYGQKVYGVDGKHAVVVDLSVEPPTVSKWTPTAGSLPGATPDGMGGYLPGTTTATELFNFVTRIGFFGMPEDDRAIHMCAVDDPLDLDYGDDSPGRAFATPVDLPGKIGDTITCCVQAANGLLVVGTKNSIWTWWGDPALGLPKISPVLLTAGISGPRAAMLVSEGRVLVHTPEGVYIIPGGGDPMPINKGVLTEGLEFNRADADRYNVQLTRDPQRSHVHFFMTPKVQGAAVHFAYDERTGGFLPNTGGWWPDDWPAYLGPTASIEWNGALLMGTFNGLITEFTDTGASDDGATPIQFKISAALLASRNRLHDVIMSAVQLTLAYSSDDATVKVFGGRTAQEAYSSVYGRLLFAGTVSAMTTTRPILRKARAPAIVVDIVASAKRVLIEALHCRYKEGRILTQRLRTPVEAPGPSCQAPYTLGYPMSAASGFASGGGASGDPGSGASGTPGSVLSGSGGGSAIFTSNAVSNIFSGGGSGGLSGIIGPPSSGPAGSLLPSGIIGPPSSTGDPEPPPSSAMSGDCSGIGGAADFGWDDAAEATATPCVQSGGGTR